MKKLTEEIPINLEETKLGDLPIENCMFWDYTTKSKGLLSGFSIEKHSYMQDDGQFWKNCVKLEERYPRDVPEGFKPLPDDMPFLAYVGIYDKNFPKGEYYLFNLLSKVWQVASDHLKGLHVAIDVSTKWASEKFPEIVEAMEYESIYQYIHSWGKEKLVGHKLGDKNYDLDWNEISEEEVSDKTLCDSKNTESDSQKEPPDFESYQLSFDGSYGHPYYEEIVRAYKAGKARGKWEATKWKYGEAEMRTLLEEAFKRYFPSNDDVQWVLKLSRQTKEE